MKQIALVVSAMILGLAFGHLTGGLKFSSAVCLAAGLFLVVPSLFKFQLVDIAIIKNHLPSVFKNLIVNYLMLTAAALGIGYLSQDVGIAAALFLLALLPGGGMVMMWIKQSGAHVMLGFILFMLNLALLLPATIVFGEFQTFTAGWFPAPDLSKVGDITTGREIKPFAPFMILIVIPFLVSRVALKFFPMLIKWTGEKQQLISKATMFAIVFYLFSLTTSQLLFQVSLTSLLKALVATAAFYVVAVALGSIFTNNTDTGKAVYWHIVTRYITLALILAVFSIDKLGASFILPIMIAYFIQIGAAGFLSDRQNAVS
ncbi:MAG: hypothetical protein V3V04_03650 [Rhizobiaceae bacterium]